MAAPLRSENPGQTKSMQFAHFGVLDTGGQSKASTVTSLVINFVIAFVIVVIGAATTQTVENNKKLTVLTEPILKKVEPVKPKVVPPKPKLPDIVKVPQIKAPVVKMEAPKPILLPAAPKQVVAMAAPKVVNLGHPQAASVVNNDPHPSAVRLGTPDSPISNLHGPAVASVNLARGMPGMNAANTGNGPAATKVILGNGSPGGTSIKGNGVVAVAGIPHGVPGGTGPLNSTGRVAGPVNLGQSEPPPAPKPAALATVAPGKALKVISKPKPEYTAEARQMHIEGVVTIHIRVLPNGSVEVVGVTKPLGYGLDESARRAILATKFEPATDAFGHPVIWDGLVNVTFQLAG